MEKIPEHEHKVSRSHTRSKESDGESSPSHAMLGKTMRENGGGPLIRKQRKANSSKTLRKEGGPGFWAGKALSSGHVAIRGSPYE